MRVIKNVKSPSKDLLLLQPTQISLPFLSQTFFHVHHVLIIYCFILLCTCLKCVKFVLQLDCKLHEGRLMSSMYRTTIRKQKTTSVDEDVERREPLYTVGGYVNG